MLFDRLDIVPHMKISDFLEFVLALLQGRQQYLGLVLLLHFFVKPSLVLRLYELGLQLHAHFDELLMLLLSLLYGLLDLLPFPLLLLLLLDHLQCLLPLLLLPVPALLLSLQFLHLLPAFLLLAHDLPYFPLMLLFGQNLLEIYLQVAQPLPLRPLPSDLVIQILYLFRYGLSPSLALQSLLLLA